MPSIEWQDEPIGSQAIKHDNRQFEMKLDYAVHPKDRRAEYLIETYFFIPSSLDVYNDTYPKETFYKDMGAYIRFKTPAISIEKLLEENNSRSPFFRLRKPLDKILSGMGKTEDENTILHEIRLLGCIFNSYVRDQVSHVKKSLRPYRKNKKTATAEKDAYSIIEKLVLDGHELLKAFRAQRVEALDSVVPQSIREHFDHINEFLSQSFERGLTNIHKDLGNKPIPPSSLLDLLSHYIENEFTYRKSSGYRSIIFFGTPNEEYIFRVKALKKFVHSVLYLNVRKVTENWGIQNFVASIAAGAAMLWAILIAVWSQIHFGPTSITFMGIAVLAYVVKDRLKDWLKLFFTQKMTDYFLYDYRINITDPIKNKKLGECREAVTYLPLKKVPSEIAKLRKIDGFSALAEEGRAETVLKYQKKVTLYPSVILNVHSRVRDINDIIRFNVGNWLSRVPDSQSQIDYYDIKTRKVSTVPCHRVVHINLIVKLSTPGTKNIPAFSHLEKIRLILDRKGLQRLEQVYSE